LLSIGRDILPECNWSPTHCTSDRSLGNLATDFITPDVFKANLVKYMNPVDNPTNGRFPINCLKNTPRSGRRDHIVTHPFRFHFWPREACVIAPYLELDSETQPTTPLEDQHLTGQV